MKVSPCEICLEETCGGKHNCDCINCKVKDKCPRILRPTVRITNKCTQKCMHCCFSSNPGSSIMMSVETAENVAKFFEANDIHYANVMGGEFFCNPEWEKILNILADSVMIMRLVTNSDWAGNEKIEKPLKEFIEKNREKLRICLSKDQWHTNRGVERADEFLKPLGVKYQIETPEEGKDYGVVPVGRGELIGFSGFYSFMGAWCHNPEHKYTFLVGEDGEIYKCDFGILSYANIKDYLEGGFAKTFKELNTKFSKLPVLHCKMCIYAFEKMEKGERCIKRE